MLAHRNPNPTVTAERSHEGSGRRRFGALLAALLAVALVTAGGAHAATGELSFAECLEDEDSNLEGAKCANAPGLEGAASVAVSGDGRSLYASSFNENAIARFSRNPTTGALSFAQCLEDEDTNSEGAKCANAPGLDGARSVAVSGDGKSLYAASFEDDAIVSFDRNTTTGALAFAQCFEDEDSDLEGTKCANAPGLEGAASVAVGVDGSSLYAASAADDAIARFDRDTTGALSFAQCLEDEDSNLEGAKCANAPGLAGAQSVTVSADGRSLYAASFTDGAIARFDRDPTAGALSFAQCLEDEDSDFEGPKCANAPGLDDAASVAVSGDGRSLYAASGDGTIAGFSRNTITGALAFAQCFLDEDTLEGPKCANVPGLAGAASVAVSADGRSLYVASFNDDAIARFNRELSPTPAQPLPVGAAPSNEFSFGKVKRNKKKGTAKLIVTVPGPGGLELAKNKKVKGAEKPAEAAGRAKLPIKPKRKAKQKLDEKGKVKVKAEVTYTPTGGTSNTKQKKVKLIKR
jgi:6-phosphogluconolactonase (cycloisomerase 2 family)